MILELALSQGWCHDINEWFSEEPNIESERGFTWPRIEALLGAYQVRNQRQLKEFGVVQAHAFHSPNDLNRLFVDHNGRVIESKADELGLETESF